MKIDIAFSDAPRVSVIIVATSSFDLLRACLASVARFGPSTIPFETILVLNEAGPDVEAALRATVTGAKNHKFGGQSRSCRSRKSWALIGQW